MEPAPDTTIAARAKAEGTPLIDGDTATFVWLGADPPRLIGDFNGFGWRDPALPATEVEPRVWTHTLTLPADAYIEYLYATENERLLDPLNSRRITNGAGGFNNFLAMPEHENTPLTRVRRGVPRGTLTRHQIAQQFLLAGGKRTVHLYRPPVDEPCPLLVVFDGQDYLTRARLPAIVDNLIARQRIEPVAMALVNHGAQARFIEYDCSEATLAVLVRTVLPLAREHLNLVDDEGAHGVLGASMGGLMALYTGMRLPGIFGHVISQSGAFGFELEGMPPVIDDLVRHDPPRPLRVWLDAGEYESLLEPNRKMLALLEERGYAATLHQYAGGHNYTSWRNDVWRGLEWQFGR